MHNWLSTSRCIHVCGSASCCSLRSATLAKESTLKVVFPLRTAPLGTLNLKSNLAPYTLLICSGTYPCTFEERLTRLSAGNPTISSAIAPKQMISIVFSSACEGASGSVATKAILYLSFPSIHTLLAQLQHHRSVERFEGWISQRHTLEQRLYQCIQCHSICSCLRWALSISCIWCMPNTTTAHFVPIPLSLLWLCMCCPVKNKARRNQVYKMEIEKLSSGQGNNMPPPHAGCRSLKAQWQLRSKIVSQRAHLSSMAGQQ